MLPKIRITVVGDGGSGKTCMLIVYKDKKFNDSYCPTVFDSYSMEVPIRNQDHTVILQDTAGQEDFDKLRQLSYKDTDVFILCYSIDNRDSFENISQLWVPELKNSCPRAKMILAATKSDLEELREVSYKEGYRLHKQIRTCEFIESSAKFNRNIQETINAALLAHVTSSSNTQQHRSSKSKCIIL